MNAVETVSELVASCNARDLGRVLALFNKDTIYHNMPTETLRGVEGVRSVMQPFLENSQEIQWIVHAIAQVSTDVVLVERTDRFKINGRWLILPVMGAFEVHGGIISHWRDYYDQTSIKTQLDAAFAGVADDKSPSTPDMTAH